MLCLQEFRSGMLLTKYLVISLLPLRDLIKLAIALDDQHMRRNNYLLTISQTFNT